MNKNIYMEEAGEDGAASGGTEATEVPVEGAESSGEGLLANAGESAPESTETEAGEKPDYIKEQFWDAEKNEVRLDALAKSQADFEKKARAKVGDVPSESSEYDITIPDGVEIALEGDPIIDASKEIALKHGLSKEAYDGFMAEMISTLAEHQEPSLDLDSEKAKLGDRADSIIEGVSRWADNLVDVGLLSDNERQAMNDLGATADGIKALNKIRIHYTREPGIPMETSTEEGAMSAEEYYNAVGSERYATDPDYRRSVKEQARRIFGTNPAGTSKSGLGVR